MSSTAFEIDDPDGSVRIAGVAGAPDATAGQVLTADGAGFAAWEDGGIPGVTVSGTPDVGQAIIATAADAAGWADPDTVIPEWYYSLLGAPSYPSLSYGALEPFAADGFGSAITTPPMLVAAMDPTVTVEGNGPSVQRLPASGGDFDLTATLLVTNMVGTEAVSVAFAGTVPEGTPGGFVDVPSGIPTAIAGADLTWDVGTQSVITTLGGVFVATLLFSGEYD